MPGLNAAASNENATLYPADYDPLDAIAKAGDTQVELLQRIASALENAPVERDTIRPLYTSDRIGSVVDSTHPRIRGKWLVITPLVACTPTIKAGTNIVFQCVFDAGALSPTVIPWPQVWQEGQDIEFYDAASATPGHCLAWIIGTTE